MVTILVSMRVVPERRRPGALVVVVVVVVVRIEVAAAFILQIQDLKVGILIGVVTRTRIGTRIITITITITVTITITRNVTDGEWWSRVHCGEGRSDRGQGWGQGRWPRGG